MLSHVPAFERLLSFSISLPVPPCQLCGVMNASVAVFAGLLPYPTYLCQVISELLLPSLCVCHVRPNLVTLSTLFSISTAVSVGQSSFPSPPSACPRALSSGSPRHCTGPRQAQHDAKPHGAPRPRLPSLPDGRTTAATASPPCCRCRGTAMVSRSCCSTLPRPRPPAPAAESTAAPRRSLSASARGSSCAPHRCRPAVVRFVLSMAVVRSMLCF